MQFGELFFRLRGYTPIPFLLVAVIWAEPRPLLVAWGALLGLFGELLRISSLRHAGGATRTRHVGAPELVTSGPYARVRNPLYLANMMLYSGFALAAGAFLPWLPIAIVLFFSWQYGMIISLEEVTLKGLFGEAYGRYCSMVPRLWPRLGSDSVRKGPPRHSLSEAVREERSTLIGLLFSWLILLVRVVFFPPLT